MFDIQSKLEERVYQGKSLSKVLSRRYWIFASDVGELRYGLEALVWTTNKKLKAKSFLLNSEYSHNYLLDVTTGNYFVLSEQKTLVQISLALKLQNNQNEFEYLSNKDQ